MDKLKQKLRRTKYQLTRNMTVNRFLILIFVLLCLNWTYNAIVSLSRNWQLEQQLGAKQREAKILELEVETIELENQYLASSEYQELAARDKANKILDGESLVYLPPNSDAAKNKYATETVATTYTEPSNFRQWLSFLFGI